MTLPTTGNTPKGTKSLNLMMIEKRLSIDGQIAYADRDKFKNLMNDKTTTKIGKGAFDVTYITYSASTFSAIFEKFTITENPVNAGEDMNTTPEFLTVKFSLLISDDL